MTQDGDSVTKDDAHSASLHLLCHLLLSKRYHTEHGDHDEADAANDAGGGWMTQDGDSVTIFE